AGYEIISSTIPKIGMRIDLMDNGKILINNNANGINMTCCVLTNPPRTTWKHDISYGSALIAGEMGCNRRGNWNITHDLA
ncbi:MAG: hypothetical protein R6T91_02525, partial [Bacteroidales bacterium]